MREREMSAGGEWGGGDGEATGRATWKPFN